MPKNIQKSLQDYVSKIKKQAPNIHFLQKSPSQIASKLLPMCKNPKSLMFFTNQKGNKKGDSNNNGDQSPHTPRLEDVDNFLNENFKSLYFHKHDHYDDYDNEFTFKMENNESSHDSRPTPYDTPKEAFACSPKFFSSPLNPSRSIPSFVSPTRTGGVGTSTPPDDIGSSSVTTVDDETKYLEIMEMVGGDCITILTKTSHPYDDFRKSMQEMIESRAYHNKSVNWEFMEQLLFFYLKLNEKKQYRYILGAFTDLIVSLRQNSNNLWDEGSHNFDVETISTSTEGEMRFR